MSAQVLPSSVVTHASSALLTNRLTRDTESPQVAVLFTPGKLWRQDLTPASTPASRGKLWRQDLTPASGTGHAPSIGSYAEGSDEPKRGFRALAAAVGLGAL